LIGVLVAQGAGHGDPGTSLAHVHPDHPLSVALSRMGETGHATLPVVSRANAQEILGIVTLADILKVYGVQRPNELALAPEEQRASA
jgi:CBS domain-containing protein